MFKLEESLRFIRQLIIVSDVRELADECFTPQEQPAEVLGYIYVRPKINIKVSALEVELIDENDPTQSKLSLGLNGLNGRENKQLGKCQLNIQSINFKIFDFYILKNIEMKYLFDEKS